MPPIPPHLGGGSAPYKSRKRRKTPALGGPSIGNAAKPPAGNRAVDRFKQAAAKNAAPVAAAARRGRRAAPIFQSRRRRRAA